MGWVVQYGKMRSFGSRSEYIIDTVMELDRGRLFYAFCTPGAKNSCLRAVDASTGDHLWTYAERAGSGAWWTIHGEFLISTDQILDTTTGLCLFDFFNSLGAEEKLQPYFIQLDEHHLMFEVRGAERAIRYLVVDTCAWLEVAPVELELCHSFIYEGCIYGWVQGEKETCLYGYRPLLGSVDMTAKIEAPLQLRSAFRVMNYVVVTSDYATWLKIDLHSRAVSVIPLSAPDNGALHPAGVSGGNIYFSSCSGLQEYSIVDDSFRQIMQHYVSSVCVLDGILYGIESYQDEGSVDHDAPFALSLVDGQYLWNGPSLRNCNHLRVSELGVFVGIAGGKIHHFPALQHVVHRRGKASKSKAKPFKLDLSHSPYIELLSDPIGLLQAIQRRVVADGHETTVAAVAASNTLGLVAFVEYGDDVDFPLLRLLDLRTNEILAIDSTDLINAPMIDDIAFTNEDGKLQLGFRSGGQRLVSLDVVAKTVLWE